VLLLGYGSIGRAVEARLAPFAPAATVRVARRAREGVSPLEALPELLPEADVVVLLLPLTAETRGIIDAGALSLMKPGALLVNAARGALVDTGALLDVLNGGRIRAVLDVTDPEPLPPGHPLWRAPGLLVTPHVAGITRDIEKRTAVLVRDQIARFARGEELANQVRDGY
jgi:phosphoglycerate dehydrogenase-like enzyme